MNTKAATTTIHVSNSDILLGMVGNVYNCPIALALDRQFPGFRAYVDPQITFLEDLADQYAIKYVGKLPDDAELFIRAYDDGEEVLPFSFTLELEPYDDGITRENIMHSYNLSTI